MLMTTTHTLQDRRIEQYLGVVSSEVILGANVIRDIFAGFRDFFGGRSAAYEEVLIEAKKQAMGELERRALEMGANAVIGIDLDFQTVGDRGGMLMVAASGTAVIVN
jgi:uncharacterized protein YbjQ (UPF0145 family)